MKLFDGISRPNHGPVTQFLLAVHPLALLGVAALIGLIAAWFLPPFHSICGCP